MADAKVAPTTTEPTKTDVAKEGFQQGSTETATPPEAKQKTEPPQPRTFTEAEVHKIREDEKGKVYGELTKAQQELQKFQAAEADRAKKAQEAEAKAQAEAKKAAEADMDAKQLLQSKEAEWTKQFEQSNKSWEERFNQINAEREQERAIAEKERKFHEFVAYRNDRLNAVRDSIAPELIDLVSGSTPEELEASITTLQGKSEQIAQTVQQYAQQARASQRGVSSASFPAVGPDTDNPAGKQYTAEDIAGMNYEQYAEFRRKMGIGSSQGKGLFG